MQKGHVIDLIDGAQLISPMERLNLQNPDPEDCVQGVEHRRYIPWHTLHSQSS